MRQLALVPGLMCTEDLYRSQVADLPSARIVIADTTSDSSIEAMAERLIAELADDVVLCGLSMGGYVALEVMRRRPEKIAHLVLMATSAHADTTEQSDMRRRLMTMARAQGIKAAIDALRPRMTAKPAILDADLQSRIVAMAERVGVETFCRQQEAIIARRDQHDTLSAIRVPADVVVGTEDKIIPPASGMQMAERIERATLSRLSGVGHMITMEAPDEATALLRRALA